ncbi:MAG: FprA family A-type flavoprotein, partial [Candidatus Omnitrophica bacterium]|nr:FprA family A-type flavoprotein [Candidatus Omnitrophota bacterium]
LLSGDVFGGYSLPSIFDDDEKMISQYLSFSRKYLVNVIGHYRQHVIKNIEKLGNLKIKILAPLHGLVWRNTPQKIINCYFNWAKGIPEKGKIVVVFGSMYGFMEEAIGFLVQILQEQGYRTLVFKFTDKAYDSLSDALGEIVDSEGLVLGCSIYENEIFPYMRYFLSLLLEKVDVQKPVLVVTSYGWSRVARKKIEEIFAHTNFKIVEIVDFKGKLNGEIEKSINCALEKFISSLT